MDLNLLNFSECRNCKHAIIGNAIRQNGSGLFIQLGENSVGCVNQNIRNLTFNENRMICSDYEPRN